MQERCGSRLRASIEESRAVVNDLVAGERAVILARVEEEARRWEHQSSDYAEGKRSMTMQITAVIKARGTE
jgi:hypothetical protein